MRLRYFGETVAVCLAMVQRTFADRNRFWLDRRGFRYLSELLV